MYDKIALVVENHLHSESIVRGVFSTVQKAWEHISELEDINKDDSITYDVQTWIVDYLVNP